MIIIADAHLSPAKGNIDDFFQMLGAFEQNNEDLVFLGDIFDLWIALPSYESDFHRKFISWCREQRNRRKIGFIEGNHEFFLAEERGKCFSWCSNATGWRDGNGNFFAHGDQINRNDKNYLLFRKLTKNKVAKTLIRHLPFGPFFAESLKLGLKKTNQEIRRHLPEDEIAIFAEARFADGVKTIFLGHFHQEYNYRNPKNRALYILPAWYSTGQVTLYESESERVGIYGWKELTRLLSAESALRPGC
jgi:UDP-2,3-diacylglucosamine hydrolase